MQRGRDLLVQFDRVQLELVVPPAAGGNRGGGGAEASREVKRLSKPASSTLTVLLMTPRFHVLRSDVGSVSVLERKEAA